MDSICDFERYYYFSIYVFLNKNKILEHAKNVCFIVTYINGYIKDKLHSEIQKYRFLQELYNTINFDQQKSDFLITVQLPSY